MAVVNQFGALALDASIQTLLAKISAAGTAGTASANVLTVQGIASMTPLQVDGSAVTQPVSAVALTDGTQKAQIIDGAGDVLSVNADGSINVSAGGVSLASDSSLQDILQMLTLMIGRLGQNDGVGRMYVNATIPAAVASAQSGVWTVQPGNTSNTAPWLVNFPSMSTTSYGPLGLGLDQHYQSQQAAETIRNKITTG